MTPIDLVMAARGLDSVDALRWLAPLLGVDLERADPAAEALAARILANARSDPAEAALADERGRKWRRKPSRSFKIDSK